jgi:hypothetical protein
MQETRIFHDPVLVVGGGRSKWFRKLGQHPKNAVSSRKRNLKELEADRQYSQSVTATATATVAHRCRRLRKPTTHTVPPISACALVHPYFIISLISYRTVHFLFHFVSAGLFTVGAVEKRRDEC